MAIREIMWTVSEDASSILPSTVQSGGVQGEHNATRSIWVIGKDSPLTNPEYSLYVECTDTTGGEPDHQGPLTIEDGKVSVLLPLAWTQYGGVSTMRLVAEKTESKSEKVITLECRVSFDSRPAGPKGDGVMRGFMQAMLDETQAAREDAFRYREAAGSAAREANEAMLQAKAAPASAQILMRKSEANVTAASERATVAQEAAERATQAAGSAAEASRAAQMAEQAAEQSAKRAEDASAENAAALEGIDAALDSSMAILDELLPPAPITFTVANTEYQALSGMTWLEWVNSEYNIKNGNKVFICSGENEYVRPNGNPQLAVRNNIHFIPTGSNRVIANAEYYVDSIS